MEKEVLVTVIVLATRNNYLLSTTLDSILQQTDKRFEIVVLTQNILPKDLNLLMQYLDKIKLVEVTPDADLATTKIKILKKVKGKYVHFLSPEDYYLSKFSLEYALKKAESKNFPDLICFAFLQRSLFDSPVVKQVSFSKTFLGGERYPISSRDVFFLRSAAIKVGGSDGKYKYLEGFDVISKIYLTPGSRILCCRRVLCDYNFQKNTPKQVMVYIVELLSIIYNRYGFFSLFRLVVVKEILEFVKYWLKNIKSYFMQVD